MVLSSYAAKKEALVAAMRAAEGGVRLAKDTSNLFRDRAAPPARRLDVRHFNRVLGVDPAAGSFEAEAMAPYADLAAATFAKGVLPAVVPELKSITIGGALVGLGIEASSFRYGLVHETVTEAEVLLASGDIVLCRADNEHRDLFFGLPNSFGTLGYALKVKARAVPAKPYVHLRHIRHRDTADFFGALGEWCGRDIDFLEGTVFGRDEMYLSIGRFADAAPYTSDYSFERIYYKSVRERSEDWLDTLGFIWRWDTDWFWCSRYFFAENPIVRRLLGRKRLNSVTYMRWMRLHGRLGFLRHLDRLLRGLHWEAVIQDVDVPLERAAEFLDFFRREIGILPVWICPVRRFDAAVTFPMFPMRPGVVYVNFGFWDVVKSREPHEPGYFNRLVEQKVAELGGLKSLYSDAFYPEDEFWRLHDRAAYDRLKAKYDPQGRLRNLYDKCVRKL
jgi:FAD/FMN-containing dehydrogenase